MTTLVVLSVVDIVLLIAGLAFYLYVVGGQLTRVADEPRGVHRDRRAPSWRNAEPIEPGVEQHQPHRRRRRRCAAAALRHGRGHRRRGHPQPDAAGRARRRPGPPAGGAGPGCTTAWATPRTATARPGTWPSRRSPRSGRERAGAGIGRLAGHRFGESGSRPVVSGPVVGAVYSPIHSSFHDAVVLLLVAARVVDRGQLPGDLLAVRGQPAGHLVGADVELPAAAGATDPARRPADG